MPPADRVQRHFDRNTHLYSAESLKDYAGICETRLAQLERFKSPSLPLRVLDAGCGSGAFADAIHDRFPKASLIAIDSSLGMLLRNQPRPAKRLVQADALHLPFRPGQFDVVHVDTVMHHLIDFAGYRPTLDRITAFLRQAATLLAPGGLLLVREIYHESPLADNFHARVIYELTRANVPSPAAAFMRKLNLNTARAGVCFLTRRQWSEAFARANLSVASMIDRVWPLSRFNLLGLKRSGDLYYVLSPS